MDPVFVDIEPSSKTVIKVEPEDQNMQQNAANKQAIDANEESKSSSESDSTPDLDNDLSLSAKVTRLSSSNGSEVHLIGTAHFSQQSVEDVQRVIRAVKPSAVVLELCPERAFMLTLDEQSLVEQNKKLSYDKIRGVIAQKGVAQGLVYIVMIKMSASLTEKLGLAPGSEFRAAAAEARKIPACSIILGDRSLRVTVARAAASISAWQKIKLVYQALINDVSITQEDVERCKDKDILEELLKELGGEYPGFQRVILEERNVFLAHSIYRYAQHAETSTGPQKIVAIVGMGHVKGIVEHWGKTTNEQIVEYSQIPRKTKTQIVMTKTIKYCSLALVIYFGYRLITPSNIQKVIHNKLFGS